MEVAIDLKQRYTYADYLTWADDVMRELIDGFVHLMSPAPKLKHQRVCGILTGDFRYYVRKSNCKCEVFPAPFDVRLPKNGEKENDQIYNVVQPDICVVCDPSKLDEDGCIGAPDLIVEVLSKSSRRRDLQDKFNLYEKSGVREYWIANPKAKTITAYILQPDGKYDDGSDYITDEKIPVHIFNGYEIDVNEIF